MRRRRGLPARRYVPRLRSFGLRQLRYACAFSPYGTFGLRTSTSLWPGYGGLRPLTWPMECTATGAGQPICGGEATKLLHCCLGESHLILADLRMQRLQYGITFLETHSDGLSASWLGCADRRPTCHSACPDRLVHRVLAPNGCWSASKTSKPELLPRAKTNAACDGALGCETRH